MNLLAKHCAHRNWWSTTQPCHSTNGTISSSVFSDWLFVCLLSFHEVHPRTFLSNCSFPLDCCRGVPYQVVSPNSWHVSHPFPTTDLHLISCTEIYSCNQPHHLPIPRFHSTCISKFWSLCLSSEFVPQSYTPPPTHTQLCITKLLLTLMLFIILNNNVDFYFYIAWNTLVLQ